MVDFLNKAVFKGDALVEGELVVDGGLTVGPGGAYYGEPAAGVTDSWPVYTRVRVADVAERDALVAWRNTNAPISVNNPLCVWRANGSSTGVLETTIDGTNWFAESPSAGDIEMTLAGTAPYGWLLLQGQTLANADVNYPALWANADAAFRSGTSLILPDLRGRVPVGAGQGTGLTLRNLATVFGGETATLSVANLPAHNHTGTTGSADRGLNHSHWRKSGHIIGANPGGAGFTFEVHDASAIEHETSTISHNSDPATGVSLDHKHPFTTANTGSGTGHANTQPSVVVNFKVKV